MSQVTPSEIKLYIAKELKYQSLLFQDLVGKFDHDLSSKLEYFEKIWNLHHDQSTHQSQFTLFVEKEIERSKRSLDLLLRERSFHSLTSIFSIVGILVLVWLFIDVAIASHSIFNGTHYFSFLGNGVLFLSACTAILVWHIRRGHSSGQREVTLNRYHSFLKELQANKKDATLFFEQLQKYQDAPLITLDATPAQVVAFLNALLKNIVVSSSMNHKELTQFFEDKCQQSNGSPYQNLQTLLSQYKNGDRDAEHALSEFVTKLTR